MILVPETDDRVNPLGVKGLGELGNVGGNAAVANAVFHATGVRVRDLPIRLEKVLSSWSRRRAASPGAFNSSIPIRVRLAVQPPE